jgi:low affinity Fe/Cu permease
MANQPSSMFSEMARRAACALGTSTAFALAGVSTLLWVRSGPLLGFSDTRQIAITADNVQ